MKRTPAPFLVALSAVISSSAQIFPVDNQFPVYWVSSRIGNAQLTGNTTVDNAANTAAFDGNLHLQPANWVGTASQSILVPGDFPDVFRYNNLLTVDFSYPSIDAPITINPVEPTYLRQTTFVANFPAEIFDVPIEFTYKLQENGVQVAEGSGSYTLRGGPHQLHLDVDSYPGGLSTLVQVFQLSPTSADPIISITPPHGPTMVIHAQSLSMGQVPEPETYAACAAAGLLALALWRKSSRAKINR